MIQLIELDNVVFKWNVETGQSWLFDTESDTGPQWIEIKHRVEEK